MKKEISITFIGAGHMASCLIAGLIQNHYAAKSLCATAPHPTHLNVLAEKYGIRTQVDNHKGIDGADIVILAVKPQDASDALASIVEKVQASKPLIVSVITGWSVKALQNKLGKSDLSIVRCVPNTPALIESGVTALYANEHCSQQQKALAESIFSAVSRTFWIKEEKLMNVVTALSGSGPAYFFTMMDALQKAGVKLGLPAEIAKLLTLHTALGAAKMALQNEEELSVLCAQVASKGGTTEQGLRVLKENHLEKILLDTVTAARDRALQLAAKEE